MSSNMKAFFAFILTFVVTRTGELSFKFKPTDISPFWLGVAVDFSIWLLIFSACYWIIGKFGSKQPVKP